MAFRDSGRSRLPPSRARVRQIARVAIKSACLPQFGAGLRPRRPRDRKSPRARRPPAFDHGPIRVAQARKTSGRFYGAVGDPSRPENASRVPPNQGIRARREGEAPAEPPGRLPPARGAVT